MLLSPVGPLPLKRHSFRFFPCTTGNVTNFVRLETLAYAFCENPAKWSRRAHHLIAVRVAALIFSLHMSPFAYMETGNESLDRGAPQPGGPPVVKQLSFRCISMHHRVRDGGRIPLTASAYAAATGSLRTYKCQARGRSQKPK